MEMSRLWSKCNVCKKPIAFQQKFWVCNVSTCNRRRTGLRFCSVECYDTHLPDLNHRESWAVEVKAPSAAEWSAYVGAEGEDAVWPPPVRAKKTEPEKPPPFVSPFGGSRSSGASGSSAPVIRRRKPEE